LKNPKKYFSLIIFSVAVLQGSQIKSLYLTSFFSCFYTPFFAAFAKQQFPVDGFLRDSVKVWLYRFPPNPSWKAVLQGRRQRFF